MGGIPDQFKSKLFDHLIKQIMEQYQVLFGSVAAPGKAESAIPPTPSPLPSEGPLPMYPTIAGPMPSEGPLPLQMRLGKPPEEGEVGPPRLPFMNPTKLRPALEGPIAGEGPLPLRFHVDTPGMIPPTPDDPNAPISPTPGPFAALRPKSLPQTLEVPKANEPPQALELPKAKRTESPVTTSDRALKKALSELASGRKVEGYSATDEKAAKAIVQPGRDITTAQIEQFKQHLAKKSRYAAPYSQGQVLEIPLMRKERG